MKKITTLRELENTADKKKAVIAVGSYFQTRPLPAAWVINFSGKIILRYLKNGMYVYKKGGKK